MNLVNNKNLFVSVIIPMKNAEKYIAKTLASILEQTGVTLEIIVIDDQSTDRSAEIVQAFNNPQIKLIKGKGAGIAEALNLGYRSATAEILTRCDADDYFCPNDRLYQQAKFLNENSDFEAVCGNFYGMDQHDNHLGSFHCGNSPFDITDNLKNGIIKPHFGSYAIRKKLFNRIGGFRPFFVTAEDIDFQLRVSEHTKVMYFPQHWYVYRLHSNSITHTQRENTKIEYEATAKKFQRQRLNTGKDDIDLGVAAQIDDTSDTSIPKSAKAHAINLALGNSWDLHAKQQKTDAIRLLANLLKKNPTSLAIIKNLILLFVKKPTQEK